MPAPPRPTSSCSTSTLPRVTGLQILAQIKVDERLKTIPVVIVTSSSANPDVWRAYELHANSYVVKPGDLSDFFAIIEKLQRYWLGATRLPPREDREAARQHGPSLH